MMTWKTSTVKAIEDVKKSVISMSTLVARYLKEIAELKGEMRKDRAMFQMQLKEKDEQYRYLLQQFVTLVTQNNVKDAISNRSFAKSTDINALSIFAELPPNSEEGYTQAELDLGGYQETVVVAEVTDGR